MVVSGNSEIKYRRHVSHLQRIDDGLIVAGSGARNQLVQPSKLGTSSEARTKRTTRQPTHLQNYI